MSDNYNNISDDYSPHTEDSLVELIEEKSGIFFDLAKRKELKQDILPLLEDLGINSYEEYYKYLMEGKNRSFEIKKLINIFTINETFFFRIEDHFTILRDTLISQILKKNKERIIRVWCAGCSSGEEVYSIAMTLMDVKAKYLLNFDFQVIGTDINDEMITFAKKGVYSGRTLNLVSDRYLKRYFLKRDHEYYVRESIKEKTSFEYLNLNDDFVPLFKEELDVIFFRNVFIYFNRETNIKIIEGFHSILKKEGYLFLGPSETLWKLTDKFELWMFKNSYIYQKPGNKTIEIQEIEPESDKQLTQDGFTFEDFDNPIIAPSKSGCDPQSDGTVFEKKNKSVVNKLIEAEDFINIADYKNAARVVDGILNVDHSNQDALILKLIIFINNSDKSGLFSFVEDVNDRIPVFPELHYILGNYFESESDIDQAISSFKKAIFIDRELIQPREKLLNLNLAQNNINAAKLEAKNIIIQIKSNKYKSFSSRFLPKIDIDLLMEHCMKIQNY